MRELFKALFIYTRRERRGILVLVALIVVVNLFRFISPYFTHHPACDEAMFLERIAQFEALHEQSRSGDTSDLTQQDIMKEPTTRKLVPINPNNAGVEDLKAIGLSDKVARTIVNYREKGGRFRSVDDLKKIYGMEDAEFERVREWIVVDPLPANVTVDYPPDRPLPNTFRDSGQTSPIRVEPEGKKGFRTRKKKLVMISLNDTDTLSWMQLNGIGRSYANRIVKYGKLLGGYHRKGQLLEVYGMSDTLFRKIAAQVREDGDGVKKISLNRASIKDLGRHPYCDFSTARAIVKYREQHGRYTSLEQLKELHSIDSADYDKLLPYLSVE